MGIFEENFGARRAAPATARGTSDRPKAQLWLNIGYDTVVEVENGEVETRFVSLPVGIPLDTQEHLPVNSRSDDFAEFQSARNDLLDQIMSAAEGLAPGQEVMLNLKIQLRRVNEEREVVASDQNRFTKKLDLVG